MDEQKESDKPVVPPAEGVATAEATKPEHHRRFFMDVRKPKNTKPATATETPTPAAPPATETKAPAEEKPAPPVAAAEPAENLPADMPDVAPAPPEEVAEITDDPAKQLEEPKKVTVTKPPKPPRQPGIGLAITATVIIVLGLAALATYAYLATNGKAPF